jgi:hypothetical protein
MHKQWSYWRGTGSGNPGRNIGSLNEDINFIGRVMDFAGGGRDWSRDDSRK